MYTRILNLKPFTKYKSLFLLGPRQSGKSTLIKSQFPEAKYIDLLETDTFRTLASSPETLRELIRENDRVIIIDEVQKLPNLLNEVQLMLDRNKTLRFVLTGSSARKLKRGNANLLGGRALFFNLYPLVSCEIGFDRIDDIIQLGGLPSLIDSPIAWTELKSYLGLYLKEEIQAGGLTRSIENFSRFLDYCAFFNTKQMNYTKIGNDAQIPPRTVKDYVQILEDTLIGNSLPSFRHKLGRKTVAIDKFYLFDIGVANVLKGNKDIVKKSPIYGENLEHLIFLELKSKLLYSQSDSKLSYWRTHSQHEVDFIIDDRIAIEVKGSSKVSNNDLKSLRMLKEELTLKRSIVVCNESSRRTTEDKIEIIPVKEFLSELWEEGL